MVIKIIHKVIKGNVGVMISSAPRASSSLCIYEISDCAYFCSFVCL